MLLKRIVIASSVAVFALLTAACSDDSKDACEHANEKCASEQGFVKADCSKANDNYDKLSDADKEKADKQIECVMDAESCQAVVKCASAT